jgi:hypothetical protein
MEHGADVGVVLRVQLDGSTGSPPEALEIASHHLLLQGIGSKVGIALFVFQGKNQLVQHQAAEEYAEKAEVEGRQDISLGSGQAETERLAPQLQSNQVAHTLPGVGEIWVYGAFHLEKLLPEMHGEAGKQFQAAGCLGEVGERRLTLPLHCAVADIMDKAENLGGIHQRAEAFAQVLSRGR